MTAWVTDLTIRNEFTKKKAENNVRSHQVGVCKKPTDPPGWVGF